MSPSLPPLSLLGPTLQRFLIARKYDVEKAFAMLMAYVEWRMDFPQEGIRDEEIKTSLEHNKVSDPQPPPPGAPFPRKYPTKNLPSLPLARESPRLGSCR